MKKHFLKTLIFHHGKLQKKTIILAITLACANKFFSLLPEFFLGTALDLVTCNRTISLLARYNIPVFQQLLILAACTVFAWLIAACLYYYELLAWQCSAQSLQHNLRMFLYNKVITSPFASLYEAGNIATTINEDINHLEKFFRFAAHDAIHLILGTIIIMSIFTFCASPLIALTALLPLPIILILSRKLQKNLHQNYVDLRNQAGTIATIMTNSLAQQNNKTILFGQESFAYYNAALAAAQTNAFFNSCISMIIMIGILMTLLISGYLAFECIISPGLFSIILLQTQRLLWPFARTTQLIDAYEQAKASMKRIVKLWEKVEKANISDFVLQRTNSTEKRS
jgi:ATP-binding cassette, subfamily B, bacterial